MGIKNQDRGLSRAEARGFTLLIAVIFMSVMLAMGLALGSLAFKQTVLASSALQSQFAFYAADVGLECALYADQQLPPAPPGGDAGANPFSYNNHGTITALSCGGASTNLDSPDLCYDGASGCALNERGTHVQLQLDGNTRCADVTVYKTATQAVNTTYIFSQGYNTSCTNVLNAATNGARIVARGLEAHY